MNPSFFVKIATSIGPPTAPSGASLPQHHAGVVDQEGAVLLTIPKLLK
jgi:hypothetical protein